ncbi:serine hydrolase domain-containing protein [Streptomyces violascens]|uniref:serine hydrolase domain-containing protein n=1 Tax=Streptomyces violascens TaxID=67381 RepID=UPI0036985591
MVGAAGCRRAARCRGHRGGGPSGHAARDRHGRSGVGDPVTRRPVPKDGYLRLGSTTKTFVATVMLQLVGEKRISLDQTVEQLLPGVVAGAGNDGRTITVRDLLRHTSGLAPGRSFRVRTPPITSSSARTARWWTPRSLTVPSTAGPTAR